MKYKIMVALAVSARLVRMSACGRVGTGSSNTKMVQTWLSAGQVDQKAALMEDRERRRA